MMEANFEMIKTGTTLAHEMSGIDVFVRLHNDYHNYKIAQQGEHIWKIEIPIVDSHRISGKSLPREKNMTKSLKRTRLIYYALKMIIVR